MKKILIAILILTIVIIIGLNVSSYHIVKSNVTKVYGNETVFTDVNGDKWVYEMSDVNYTAGDIVYLIFDDMGNENKYDDEIAYIF